MDELIIYIKALDQDSRPTDRSVTFEQGSNWFIDDLEDSYAILEQGQVGPWVCQRVEKRPQSWTGPEYIGSETAPMRVIKEDERGRWIRVGAWHRIHWRQGRATLFDVGGDPRLIEDLNVWMFGRE
jgi:hypothetical protein